MYLNLKFSFVYINVFYLVLGSMGICFFCKKLINVMKIIRCIVYYIKWEINKSF